MNRSLTDIRDSGLLELYVLSAASPAERAEVEAAVRAYPELSGDLQEMERVLEQLAFAKTDPPSKEVLTEALRQVGGSSGVQGSPSGKTRPDRTALAMGLGLLALLAALVAAYLWSRAQTVESDLVAARTEVAAVRSELEDCRTQQAATAERIAVLDDLQRDDARVVALAPSDAFPEASLLLYDNPVTERNYLTVAKLPALPADQAYQLWSIKGEASPIPLEVFTGDTAIVPVRYEAGTDAYAITVEAAGGAQQPNLDRLVGKLAL